MRGRGGQHGEPLQQFDRIKQQMRRLVRPRVLQFEPHLTLSRQTEPVLCDGRPQRVSAHPFDALALTRRDEDARAASLVVVA